MFLQPASPRPGRPEQLRIFLNRFLEKLKRRGKNMSMDGDEAIVVLASVAKHAASAQSAIYSLQADWVVPIVAIQILNANQAKELFSEAASGGLIVIDTPGRWFWKHKMVSDYLALSSEQYLAERSKA